MINVASTIIMAILLLFFWALLKSGSDSDDQWEERIMEPKEDNNDVY